MTQVSVLKNRKSIILILCDFVLQFDLSDIRDRLHGLSEDKMTGYHYHKYVSKFVVDLLNGLLISFKTRIRSKEHI